MRIGIDARFIRSAGVERYTNELIRHLSLIDKEHQYIIYYPSGDYLNHHRIERSNFRSYILPAPVFSMKEHVLLNYRLRKDKVDLLHSTNYWVVPIASPCPVISTAHDVCAKSHPEFITLKARAYARMMLPYALKKSSKVFTVSEFSKNEIIRYYPEVERKLVVTYNGRDERFHPVKDSKRIAEVQERYGIGGEYLLYVGSMKKNKNIPLLIQAYSRLSDALKNRFRLVIAGKRVSGDDKAYQEAKALSNGEPIDFVGFVKEEDLPGLYSGAAAFLFASHYEGYGLPLVEAMACGLPVIAVNRSVTSEMCDQAAVYFAPDSSESLMRQTERVLADDLLRERLSREGVEQAKKFSWTATARKVLEVYQEVYQEKSRER